MSVRNDTADPSRLCQKCGLNELRRKPRSFVHRLFSLQPYQCLNCAKFVKRFRFSWLTVVIASLAVFAVGVAVLVPGNPQWFHRDAEAPPSADNGLASARTATGGQLSPFEQMMLRKPNKNVLDNPTVLKLVRANVETGVIVQMVKTSTANYDLSATAIIGLKENGVDQRIILAMIDANYSNH
jgi:hypothetical protein